MRAGGLALGACALILAALAACGDDDDRDASKPARETVDRLPDLPRGWGQHVNREAGFAVGVPPGWSASARGSRSELRSPDKLAAVSIGADRSGRALEVPPRELATATLEAGLPGVHKLEFGKPRPLKHPYRAVSLRATGVAKQGGGVRERLELAVIRRDRLATYTALVARNAERGGDPHADESRRLLASLRGRPARERRGSQRSGRSG